MDPQSDLKEREALVTVFEVYQVGPSDASLCNVVRQIVVYSGYADDIFKDCCARACSMSAYCSAAAYFSSSLDNIHAPRLLLMVSRNLEPR